MQRSRTQRTRQVRPKRNCWARRYSAKCNPSDGQRASWKSLDFQWHAYLIAQDKMHRTLRAKVGDPATDVNNVDLDHVAEELSVQQYFAHVLVIPRESVAELMARSVSHGERESGVETAARNVCFDRARESSGNVVEAGRVANSRTFRHRGRHQQDGRGHDAVPQDGQRHPARRHQTWHVEESSREGVRAAETHLPQLVTSPELSDSRQEVMLALTAERSGSVPDPTGDDPMDIGSSAKSDQKGKQGKGEGGWTGQGRGQCATNPNPNADEERYHYHKRGHIREECVCVENAARENEKAQMREGQEEGHATGSRRGSECPFMETQGRSKVSGEVCNNKIDHTLVRCKRGCSSQSWPASNDGSCKFGRADSSGRVRFAPLRNAIMLDSGAQVSAEPRRQTDQHYYQPTPSSVTGLEGTGGEEIQRYGNVELNLRSAQEIGQVGVYVGVIATDAAVEHGKSVLRSPAGPAPRRWL